MKCLKCGCEHDDDEEGVDGVDEELDASELEEAMALMKKLDMKKYFVKDIFIMRDKLNGILKEDEDEGDYNE